MDYANPEESDYNIVWLFWIVVSPLELSVQCFDIGILVGKKRDNIGDLMLSAENESRLKTKLQFRRHYLGAMSEPV